jgi:hypothetical protein
VEKSDQTQQKEYEIKKEAQQAKSVEVIGVHYLFFKESETREV